MRICEREDTIQWYTIIKAHDVANRPSATLHTEHATYILCGRGPYFVSTTHAKLAGTYRQWIWNGTRQKKIRNKKTNETERERQRYFGICNSSEVLVTLPLHSFYVSVYDLNRFMCVFCAFSCALLRSDSFSILFFSVHILEYRKMYNTLIYVYIVGGTVNSLAMTFVKWLHTQRSLLLFTHSMQCI